MIATDDSSSAAVRPLIVRRPNARGQTLRGLKELPRFGDLFLTLTEHRIRVRYKQSMLGLSWAVLQPLSMMAIFTLVFSRIAHVSTDGVPYALFAFSGLLLWSFVSTCLNNSTHSLVSHAQLIGKVYFPREILPLSYVAAGVFDLVIGCGVLLGILAWYGRPITVHLLLAVPVIVVATILTTALALLLSALQVRYRDLGLAVPLVLYLWMFSTPIAYPLAQIPGRYHMLFVLNPLTGIVESFRQVILTSRVPSPRLLLVPTLVSLILLPIAYAIFKQAETTMADVI